MLNKYIIQELLYIIKLDACAYTGQASEQLAVEVIRETQLDIIPSNDQQDLIENKATPACEGSIGSNKCVRINNVCYCFVTQQVNIT